MGLQVEIESHSGFCGGVIRAIGRAERFLEEHPGETLYSLGDIVHNEAELRRLGEKGLVTIGKPELRNISERPLDRLGERSLEDGASTGSATDQHTGSATGQHTDPGTGRHTGPGTGRPADSGTERSLSLSKRTDQSNHRDSKATVLIRAHGEPPETYSLAERLGLTVIDCTCPVVLRLQKSIREAYERVKPAGGQIIIFGKVGHAEVLGLLGQVGGDAVVVENMRMLLSALEDGSIRTDSPIEIFSQTTKSPTEYSEIRSVLASRATAGLIEHDTICSQVASRHNELSEFASMHDVIIFVSGTSSSNGKVLFDLCKSKNPRSHHICDPSELSAEWFSDGDKVGVCGATSTPGWLLRQVAEAIAGGGGSMLRQAQQPQAHQPPKCSCPKRGR